MADDTALQTCRDDAVVAARKAGATAALMVTLTADGHVRLSADLEPSLPDTTIYQMILTLGREFQRAIVANAIEPPTSSAMN